MMSAAPRDPRTTQLQASAVPGPEISLAELPLRPELVGEEPYGAPQLDVPVALNTNENPYSPSVLVRAQMAAAIERVARTLNRYPDREALELRADLAKYLGFGLHARNIWVANGSNEVMTHVLSAFGGPGRTVLTFTPTYSMYPEYARNTHTNYVTVPRKPDFTLDSELVLQAVAEHHPDVILITTPNNPTGTLTPVKVVEEILERTDALVVVDEAYQEFTEFPEDSALALLPRFGRLIVSRTMSKAFALAGGRVGYLAAAPAVVDACRIVRLPYHLSAQTQAIARVALANKSELLAQVDELRQACQDLQDWLRRTGLDLVPSQANFCLFGRFVDRHAVWQALLDEGVLVRETGPEGFLRVSAGTPEEMAAFRAALGPIIIHQGVLAPGLMARVKPEGPAKLPKGMKK
ncbi:histidinol-phosphate transaminase [Propionibacterium freudenreichii]|uniref:histidinol-phosphate transaminase n=1 Tax=Propionibacterium freudenreichii TaxID=1744 RepID=UPI00065FEA07|nr:histidinol-phosphate transaminase [Propionibacterium freudenreichii]MCT3012957.1 histidinol-phosphate transaminase [Propionibacterium freudenreichii]MCT3017829.1 histidinol-phosphate transaminase [Propionibacterium freudenreichii]MDK9610368.1 histidinol-phosphate transaminase [Propionibacterium freudenreichii]MDK9620339.1 histidinol-phosphate transaminase [Propionibacterium freudenreichii]MDK9623090.1 histidinol-phosphate transaminase [Propionibacterium freudenreichii]